MAHLTRQDLDRAPWFVSARYPFASQTMEVLGHRLHYIDEGQGDVVVLVHGTPSWSFEFRRLIEKLRTTHRCLALDHLGFGLSDHPSGADYSLAAHRARFLAWLQRLQLSAVTLVVHDFGGPIALPAALQQPQRITRLVLANTWFWPLEQVDGHFAGSKRWLNNALMRWLYLSCNFSARVLFKKAWGTHRPLDRGHHACFYRMFPDRDSRQGTWAFVEALTQRDSDFAEYASLQALHAIPTLILWGVADPLVPAVHLSHWRQLLPHAECLKIEGAGHFVLDEAAEVVLPKLMAFCAKMSA